MTSLFYLFIFFFIPPTLDLKKNSRKSTNKKIQALLLVLEFFNATHVSILVYFQDVRWV